jgi:hypothetical protein
MLPFNKVQWYLGYSRLAMIMEQDRRHWLMKTDKHVQKQNSDNGTLFEGNLDNQASYIDISTKKLPYVQPTLNDKISDEKLLEIFGLIPSALPYSYEVNGLYCARILSTQYRHQSGNKNYKIRFENCEEVYIPLAGANENDVFAFRFIKTTTKPILSMIDGNGNYTISVNVDINITNAVYYYPIDTFQPIDISNIGNGVYETILINDDEYIGYPAFWFTCDETNIGPKFSLSSPSIQFDYGNASNNMYNPFVYIMDKEYPDTLSIQVYPMIGYTFSGDDNDFNVPIDLSRITLIDSSSDTSSFIGVNNENSSSLIMVNNDWEYNQDGFYEVNVSSYNTNSTDVNSKLKPIFQIRLNASIPFIEGTKDVGYAGVDITTNSPDNSYPQNLNQWDGLPQWMADNEGSPQRLVVYAIHDTPSSSAEVPSSRQTAALILDPGVPVTSSEDELTDEQKGRVYVISNDDPIYANNALAEYPKPPRTVARICDIPVSVMQLANISGLAPTPIVDPKYVRSYASYSEKEEDRLYNELNDRWVRPTHLNEDGISLCEKYGENEFVFSNVSYLEEVDMYNYNDFRAHYNLNAFVRPNEVSLYLITNGGKDYAINDIGTIIVGGFAFDYIVSNVNESGAVTELTIAPSHEYNINLSNFDMEPGDSGITRPYGTSPRGESIGRGLKLQLLIADYKSKLPYRGKVYYGLHAFVKESDGLWMYSFDRDKNKWYRSTLITEYEVPTEEHQSTKSSYIRSILPNITILPVAYKTSGISEKSLQTISTASFVNVIDKTVIPVNDSKETKKSSIDINKFICHIVKKATANSKNSAAVIQKVKELKDDRFDSYLIWRWVNPDIPTDKEFEYGIVHRSFNNLQSTDSTSNLPNNELNCEHYVNTNAGTTIAWDTDNYGTLVWVFNPTSSTHEDYIIHPDSRDLNIERTHMNWDDVEIFTDNFQTRLNMVDSNNKLLWNIASNVGWIEGNMTPIYQHPDYTDLLNVGINISELSDEYRPCGNWELIFPRIQTFTFKDDTSGAIYTPIKLDVIRDINLQSNTIILNKNGMPVNYKTLVIDSSDSGSSMKVYNTETGSWDKI